MHTKLSCLAALALAAAAFAVPASAASSRGDASDWASLKAVSLACNHRIEGLDRTMDRSLVAYAARAAKVSVTPYNYHKLLAEPRRSVHEMAYTVARTMNYSASDCAKVTARADETFRELAASVQSMQDN